MKASGVVYFALSFFLFFHFLRVNNYSTDTVEFVGNVVALHVSDPVAIRDVAYRAVTTEAPAIVVPHILGTDLSTEEAAVRRAKHADPYRFAQFLPYFSVKPLYIEALNLVRQSRGWPGAVDCGGVGRLVCRNCGAALLLGGKAWRLGVGGVPGIADCGDVRSGSGNRTGTRFRFCSYWEGFFRSGS